MAGTDRFAAEAVTDLPGADEMSASGDEETIAKEDT